MIISLIAAVSENRIIGGNNEMVWDLPLDTRYFMKTTEGHCILTGRRNFESIPEKFRPLKNRTNIVVTRRQNYLEDDAGLKIVGNIQEGINFAETQSEQELFVIGGGQIYQQTIHLADRLYITEIKNRFKGDTYFPEFNSNEFEESSRIICQPDAENAYEMHFVVLERR
jgi:dihydrofolate reductase